MTFDFVLQSGLAYGKQLYSTGWCPRLGSFSINFINPSNEILIHFGFRIEAGLIVVNEFLADRWGDEIRLSGIAFTSDGPFSIAIDLVSAQRVRLWMQGKLLLDFFWRTDISSVRHMRTEGIQLDTEIRQLPDMTTMAHSNASELRSGKPASEPSISPRASDPAVLGTAATIMAEALRDVALQMSEFARLLAPPRQTAQAQADFPILELPSVVEPIATEPAVQSLCPIYLGESDRRTPESVGEPRPIITETFEKGWGAWSAHQNVRMGEGGTFKVQQNKSTPGIRREQVTVAESCFYEFAVEGHFRPQRGRTYLCAYDPDNNLDLTPARYSGLVDGAMRVTFMTTGRTKKVLLRVLVDQPQLDDEVVLSSAELRLLGPAETWMPDRSRWPSVAASMASVKGRDEMVVDAVLSLYPFVNEVRVYLNGYDAVPHALRLPRVKTVLSEQWGDDGDAGKFFWSEDNSYDLNLICDDDLIFAADYVPGMVAALERYDNKAIIGVHGILLKQPTPSYYDSNYRQVCRYVHANEHDCFVHVLGTGAILYDSRHVRLTRRDFQYRNMADIWLLDRTRAQNVPMVAVARPRNWVIQNQVIGGVPTIYDSSDERKANQFDTAAIQTAIVRRLWPVTIPRLQNGSSIAKPKTAFCILSGRDIAVLERCLAGFDRTAAGNHIWSVIIGIAHDTPIEVRSFLKKVSMRYELHITEAVGLDARAQLEATLTLASQLKVDGIIIVSDQVVPAAKGWEAVLSGGAGIDAESLPLTGEEALPPVLVVPAVAEAAASRNVIVRVPDAASSPLFTGIDSRELDGRSRVIAFPSGTPTSGVVAPRLHKQHSVNSMFDRVLVLNLDRRPDRLAAIGRQLDELGIVFERFAAADGQEEPSASEWSKYAQAPLVKVPEGVAPIKSSKEFYLADVSRMARTAFLEQKTRHKAIKTAGAWAYLKNFIAILELALEREYESILVLDDDARFHRNFHRLFSAATSDLPVDWKIMQLGALQYDWGNDWITWHTRMLYACNGSSVGSHATGIHWTAYAALLHQAQFFDLAFDIGALCHVKRVHAAQCLTVYPNLVIQDTSESDIASSEVQQTQGQLKNTVYRWRLKDYAEFVA